jgi:hypothetical protein
MKIDFIATNQSLSVGSYRIWINDFCATLSKLGADVCIPKVDSGFRDDSILVLSKGDAHQAVKENVQHRVKGAINIAPPKTSAERLPLDFVVVGSLEEKLSLLPHYENVVVVNLLEKLYEGAELKKHFASDEITIGYHGSHTHVSKLGGWGFAPMLKKLSETKKVKLLFVSDDQRACMQSLVELGVETIGCEVVSKKWALDEAKDDIASFDVCVLPNMTSIESYMPGHTAQVTSVSHGLYETDYAFRYKNKSNAGRCFVAHQLGIPVIADLTPSNMPMLFDEKCGFVASNPASFWYALNALTDHEVRNCVSAAALERFRKLYSATEDAKSFLYTLERIKGSV